jgi:hypothetical protein
VIADSKVSASESATQLTLVDWQEYLASFLDSMFQVQLISPLHVSTFGFHFSMELLLDSTCLVLFDAWLVEQKSDAGEAPSWIPLMVSDLKKSKFFGLDPAIKTLLLEFLTEKFLESGLCRFEFTFGFFFFLLLGFISSVIHDEV